MVLLGVALLSTLIVFSLSVFLFVNRTESEAWRGRQKESARNAAGTVGGFIRRVEDALRVVSVVKPDHLVSDSDELKAMLDENTALLEIVRVDSSGSVFASAFRDRSVLANLITIPQSQWFLQTKQGKFFIGDVQLSANNAPYLIMAVPSTEQGVVAARVQMDVLWNVVQNIQFGETGEIIVINRAGNIIAHTNPEYAIARQTLQGRPELLDMLDAPNNEWSGEYTNFHDEQVVGVTASVPGTNWIMITELTRSEAFANSNLAIFVLSFEAFILMLVVSLMVARYVRLQIVLPMDQLRDGADRIGQGDLGHRIGLSRRDEIGQLAKAFDAMAGQLLYRETRLAEQTQATFASEARYRAIVEDQTELICRFQPDGTLTFVNEAYCRYFQKQREDLIGRSFMPLIPDEDRLHVEAQFASISVTHPVVTYEHRVILPGGELRWQQWTDRALFDPAGAIMEYASVGRDITERKLTQDALRNSEANLRVLNIELEKRVQERTAALQESEERYMLAMNGANDGLWDWNLKTGEIYFSPRWKTMLGFGETEIGSHPEDWFQRIAAQDLPIVRAALSAHLNGEVDHFESEYRILDVNQKYRWMLCRGLAVRDSEGTAYRLAGSQTDITDRKLAEERLAHDALHDALTGLPNRTLFLDRLEQRLEHSKRHKDDLFAILFLDMDRFKVINDSLGHAMGDKFLVATSQRLESCLRPEDTISRLGGDEFAILLGEITDVSDAIRVTERIQSRLRGTTLLGSIHRSSTASIGITIFNGKYTDAQEMLRDADSAMYRAKSQGGGRYQVFNEEMFKNALTLLQLEADLKRAVERQEWKVFYQPVIHLASGEIAGVEALVRWRHPERGLIPPAEFIPVAEESGLIIQIGEFVLREACRQVKIWREAGHSPLWVSVNLSGRQFQDQDLLNKVTQILEETGVSGDSLRLEVTETVAMKDFEYSVKILRMLETLGIHLSLDDFGNGYSSLGYLKRFPIKSLKIDRSFIRDIEMNKNSEAITSAIISLGHNLDLEVVAEGVETEEQFAFLKAQICDEIQGFLFSRPLPAGDLEEVLNKNSPHHLKMPRLEFEKPGR